MSLDANPRAVIGSNNGPPLDEELTIDDLPVAELVERCIKVLAAAFGVGSRPVLKKKQPFETISLRQLAVYCLTHDNPDLAIVPPVKLAKIIKFDRGTVRDDRAAVERAADQDEEMRDYIEGARELILGVPAVAAGSQRFFLSMELARAKSRSNAIRLREAKRRFDETMERITRAETALEEIGRQDLAERQAELRQKQPFNPATEGRLAKWCLQ